jgi:TolB-like protein
LRRSLERYYLTAGRADPVLITIPKGGYVPTFEARSFEAAEVPPPVLAGVADAQPPSWRRWRWPGLALGSLLVALVLAGAALQFRSSVESADTHEVPRVLVEKFRDLGSAGAESAISIGLTGEVVNQLSKFRDLVVVETDLANPPPRFSLAGTVDASADWFHFNVRFTDRSDGAVLWANSYDGRLDVAEIWKVQTDIARNVVDSLAQAYGVIYQVDSARKLDVPPDDWQAYACTLKYYGYRVSLDPELREQTRICLEAAVARFPSYATAWALLAQVTIDAMRFQFPFDPKASQAEIDRILAMARRATAIDPRNMRALQAEVSALFWNREYDSARKVGEQGLSINPNDAEFLGGFGTRLAVSGDWAGGCPLVEEARRRIVGPLGYYESVLALCTFFGGDLPEAAKWIKKTPVPKNPIYHLIAAAVFGESGLSADAARETAWLQVNAPALVANVREEVRRRLGKEADAAFFLDALRKAGLDAAT